MRYNNASAEGYECEERMRKQFKGKPCEFGCVDFVTKKHGYEVKSCRLFNLTNNSNHKRATRKDKTPCKTQQHGRFMIDVHNHNEMVDCCKLMQVKPRYLFVLRLGKQTIRKVLSWDAVNEIIVRSDQWNKQTAFIRIRQVWSSEIQ